MSKGMSIGDLLQDATVIRLEPSADQMRAAIEKRIEFAEKMCRVKPGGLIQVTDSAYQEIADLTHGSVGLALEVMKMVLPSAQQLGQTRPYVVNEERIRELGLTFEALCEYWDNPLRQAHAIHMKPWYER